MNSSTTLRAQRLVRHLLGEDYANQDDFESRPGGPKDPLRQTTVKLSFKKKDFTGKRGVQPVAKEKRIGDGNALMKKRFNISFSEAKKSAVAKKPGKVSYREALIQQVVEKLAKKKSTKGAVVVVAKKPGTVRYCKETQETWEDFWEQVRREALEALAAPDPDSQAFLKAVRDYVQTADRGVPENFESALHSPEIWHRIRPTDLQRSWKQAQESPAP